MNKRNIIIVLVIFVLLAGIGVGEIVLITNKFGSFHDRLEIAEQKALTESLTPDEYGQVWQYWKNHRTLFEFFLTHHETIEVEMRLAEAHAHLRNADFKALTVQLRALIELSAHIPLNCTPKIEHIL